MGTPSPTLALALLFLPACFDEAELEGAACDVEIGRLCPDDYICVDNECKRKGPSVGLYCEETADCPAGVCLTGSHVCVGCIDHTDCVSLLCEKVTHICKGCKADYQCRSGVCDEETGICAAESSTDSP